MIVLAYHDFDRNVHIINSIDGDTVRSLSYYDTPNGAKTVRDWSHRLDELGLKSAEQYVQIMLKRGFTQVKEVPLDEGWRSRISSFSAS